jgi:hypothetical protein
MPQNWYQMYEVKVYSNEKSLYTFRLTSLGVNLKSQHNLEPEKLIVKIKIAVFGTWDM